ncbi:glycine betaine ABC transporter substrate-binding protein [Natribacillus halophilus]|uniref:Glycine betaine/proline transport system substrate-binding protein n=1 Tax=Natribacillus halophilus TaxID=549003 RepID=A0A1G8LKC1_9BACI|nr:glycine betaine ABC transporter substrate-binding protein [Natribacillus halophilus]SDI56108.1 glycine betaine/proline transport system substrate-binding protein [Natribacillus halophilus]
MRNRAFNFIAIVLVGSIISGCNADGNEENSNEQADETITFGMTPWTSTVPPTEIAMLILEDMGYETEVTEADAGAVYTGMSNGDIDVFMDSWLPNQENYLDEYSETIEQVTVSYEDADSGMVVPEYMEDINDVGDIAGNEELFDNQMYSIEEGDPATNSVDMMIEEYDLDIEQVNSSEGAMLAEATRHIENEEPVLFYGWEPHTMFNLLDAKILTNEETPEVFSGSTVLVVAHHELEANTPEAHDMLSNWSIPIEDIEEMIVQIENEDRDAEEVAREWIDNNQDRVDEMMGE